MCAHYDFTELVQQWHITMLCTTLVAYYFSMLCSHWVRINSIWWDFILVWKFEWLSVASYTVRYWVKLNLFYMYKDLIDVCCCICQFAFCKQAICLSQTALGETSPGKVVNLLSNDVSRFEWVTICMNSMWTGPLLSIVIGILLWREIGPAGLVGIAIIFIVVPVQSMCH